MPDISIAEVPLDRAPFFRRLLRVLAGTLQDVVGDAEASGYVSAVGTAVGEHIDREHRNALRIEHISREQIASVLVDATRRVEGDFSIIEEAEDRIVLGTIATVFGHITAQNLGYAGIEFKQTIAQGHGGCTVVVHLKPANNPIPNMQEYFSRDDRDY